MIIIAIIIIVVIIIIIRRRIYVIIMSRGKVKSTDGIELSSGEEVRETEEDRYKYLGILEYDRIKEQEMKDKFRKSISGGQNWFWRLIWMEGIR